MEKTHPTQHINHPFNEPPKEGDIATEKYRGPGIGITSAGYMYVSHLIAMIGGFLGFTALGMLMHQRTNAIKSWAENLTKAGKEIGVIKRGFAWIVGGVSNIAEGLSEKLFGSIKGFANSSLGKSLIGDRLNGKSIGEERVAAGLFAGGFGAVLGYAGSTVWGVLKGHKHGNKGKRQFERAQEEIKHLREVNDDLEQINDRLHAEIRKTATKYNDAAEAKAPEMGKPHEKKPVTEPLPDAAATHTHAAHTAHHESLANHGEHHHAANHGEHHHTAAPHAHALASGREHHGTFAAKAHEPVVA